MPLVISKTEITLTKASSGWAEHQSVFDVIRTDGLVLTEHWDALS